jgi:phosphopantothenoylcysteine decarboxylase/phosphopantothenate--cysteine ligase
MSIDTSPRHAGERGTALLRTVEVRGPGGIGVRRRLPGPRAPRPFVPPTPGLHRTLARIRVPGDARLALARPRGDARVYYVDGGETVAKALLARGPVPELVEPVRSLGRLLRAVHAVPAPAELAGERPPGLDRLGDWLSGRHRQAYPAYAEAVVRRRLGPAGWALVRDHYERLSAEQTGLVHGAAGLGAMIVGSAQGDVLLTGEDLAVGDWRMDVGWVIGELVELRWQLGGDGPSWQRLIQALLDGYGRDLGTDWPMIAVLRILLHVHDIASYVDWFQAGFDHYAGFVAFLVGLASDPS